MYSDDDKCVKAKLCPLSLGLAFGITKGIAVIVLALFAMHGYGDALVDLIASVYHGYAASVSGALLGGLYGLIDGFIFGVIFAFIYDWCLCCFGGRCKKSKR